MPPLPVLLTRPEDDARRLAAELRAMGAGHVEISPLLRIEGTGHVPPLSEGVILTSGNAVRMLRGRSDLAGRPAWVVGARTARMAREAGFDVRAVAEDAAALVALVPDDAPPLVHLHGEVTRGDVAGRLRARGLQVAEAVIYRQVPVDLSASARALLLAGPVLVPLYSPRSAALFARACPPAARATLRILALSDAVAQACPAAPVAVSAAPDGEAMRELLRKELGRIGG